MNNLQRLYKSSKKYHSKSELLTHPPRRTHCTQTETKKFQDTGTQSEEINSETYDMIDDIPDGPAPEKPIKSRAVLREQHRIAREMVKEWSERVEQLQELLDQETAVSLESSEDTDSEDDILLAQEGGWVEEEEVLEEEECREEGEEKTELNVTAPTTKRKSKYFEYRGPGQYYLRMPSLQTNLNELEDNNNKNNGREEKRKKNEDHKREEKRKNGSKDKRKTVTFADTSTSPNDHIDNKSANHHDYSRLLEEKKCIFVKPLYGEPSEHKTMVEQCGFDVDGIDNEQTILAKPGGGALTEAELMEIIMNC